MVAKTFFKEYLKSPFLYWGIILGTLTTFDASKIFIEILEFLLINQLHITIFFGSIMISIIISGYPIRKGLKNYSSNHDNFHRFVIGLLIFLTFMVQVPFFIFDTNTILSTLWPAIIVNQVQFDFAKNLHTMSQFIFLPILQFYNFYVIKSVLAKEGYKVNDKLRNNLRFVFESVSIFIAMIIVTGLIIWINSSEK